MSAMISIWILIAFLLIFYDLPLSIILVDYNSSWAKFVALYGEIPGHIVISLSLFILSRSYYKDWNGRSTVIFFLVLIFNSIHIVNIIKFIFPRLNFEILEHVVIFSLALIGQHLVITRSKVVDFLSERKFKKFAIITLFLALINPLIFVQTFKVLWGRTRFRDLTENYQGYSPWFIPQGITGQKSFPSGHTAMGWMLLPLMLLVPQTGRIRTIFQSLILLWGIIVGIGRIVIGAHYASDVLFSSGVAFLGYILLTNHWKEENNPDQDESGNLTL